MGLLENYFVPLYNFYLTPESFEQKVSDMTSDEVTGSNVKSVSDMI